MKARNYWDYGFTIAQEKSWRAAGVYNPLVAVALGAAGLTDVDIKKMKVAKVWEKANLGVLWQLVFNNNKPGEGNTSETGEMRPIKAKARVASP